MRFNPRPEPGGQSIRWCFDSELSRRRSLREPHRIGARVVEQKSTVCTCNRVAHQLKAPNVALLDFLLWYAVSTECDAVLDTFDVQGREIGRDEIQVGPIASGMCLREKFDLARVRHHGLKCEGLTGSKQPIPKQVRQRCGHVPVANVRRSLQPPSLHLHGVQKGMFWRQASARKEGLANFLGRNVSQEAIQRNFFSLMEGTMKIIGVNEMMKLKQPLGAEILRQLPYQAGFARPVGTGKHA